MKGGRVDCFCLNTMGWLALLPPGPEFNSSVRERMDLHALLVSMWGLSGYSASSQSHPYVQLVGLDKW